MGNGLSSKLDAHQFKQFLRMASPTLHKDFPQLENTLRLQQWADAARQAHKLLSVAKLLNLETLLPLLQTVEKANPDLITAAFQEQFRQQYQAQLAALDATLAALP